MKSKKIILLSLLLLLLPIGNVFAQTEPASASPTLNPSPLPTPTPQPAGPNTNFITISPPVRELELPRGSGNSYQISLVNQGEKPVRLILRASSFMAAGETGGVTVADEELPQSQDWVVINPNVFTLQPGERKEVNYTIAIPKNAEPGGFYFAITALLAGKTNLSGKASQVESGAAVNLNVASLNLVRIEGPVEYQAEITEFSTPKTIFEYGPVPFTARIRNLSTVHIKPLLEVEVKNTFGLNDNQILKIRQQNILPQAQRKFETSFGGKWHFGRYAATLNALYGDGQTLSYTLFFWILPWKIILAVALAIAIIILLILSIKRELDEKKILEEELKKVKQKDKTE